MISKKKLTAIVVAGLFVTPVMADVDGIGAYEAGIQGTNGYIVADDALFQDAIIKSATSIDHDKGIKLLMRGGRSDDKDGLVQINLNAGKEYQLRYVLFSDNSGQHNSNHRSEFNIENTKLDFTEGVYFRNASSTVMASSGGGYDPSNLKDLQTNAKGTSKNY